jgi:hypothetical protein
MVLNSGGVSIWPNVSPPRHADMLLVSIFQLFYKDPDLRHVGMTREDENAALPKFSICTPSHHALLGLWNGI